MNTLATRDLVHVATCIQVRPIDPATFATDPA
jgi:hypothetical protein